MLFSTTTNVKTLYNMVPSGDHLHFLQVIVFGVERESRLKNPLSAITDSICLCRLLARTVLDYVGTRHCKSGSGRCMLVFRKVSCRGLHGSLPLLWVAGFLSGQRMCGLSSTLCLRAPVLYEYGPSDACRQSLMSQTYIHSQLCSHSQYTTSVLDSGS